MRGRFPLTVAGPRRFFTGLPCYALSGIRVTIELFVSLHTLSVATLSISNTSAQDNFSFDHQEKSALRVFHTTLDR